MDGPTKHPKGSPKDILVRLRRTERDIKELLADIQSCNDNNPNFKDKPIDIGRYLVQLKKTRDVIKKVREAIAAGKTKLPSGILKPLLEEW